MELVPTVALTHLPFSLAAKAWLETRRGYISFKTFHEYKLNIDMLGRFFGDEMRLSDISADQIRAYQRMRQGQCGPFAINHECGVLQQILKRVGRWAEIAPQYQPLPLPKAYRGRALRDEDRKRLFQIAKMSKNWDGVRLCALICINSTASPKEAFTLRLKDLDMEGRTLTVQPEGSKNVHRNRPIPMNEELHEACREAMVRARSMGSYKDDHYLFPFRIHSALHDPTRHQTTFKTGWKKILDMCEKLGLNLKGLRLEDMRHHAITALLEDPNVSEETAEAIAGHIGRRTKKIYSHVRDEAKRKAVESALSSSTKKPPESVTSIESPDDVKEIAQNLVHLLSKLLKME